MAVAVQADLGNLTGALETALHLIKQLVAGSQIRRPQIGRYKFAAQ